MEIVKLWSRRSKRVKFKQEDYMANTFICEGTLKTGKNVAIAGVYVKFRILNVGTDTEDNVVYPKGTFELGPTDASGDFTGTIWINGDSGRSCIYEIELPTQREKINVIIPSSVEGTTVRLEDVIELYETSSSPQSTTALAVATAYTDTFAADASANASFSKAAWLVDLGLTDLEGLTPTDSNIIVGDGTNWVAESGATARTSLGLAIGTDVQAWDAQLDDIAALTPSDEAVMRGNGTGWVVASNFRVDAGTAGSGTEMGGGVANGINAVAEGLSTTASGICSHAEGANTTASGDFSSATGRRGKAIHDGARVEVDSQNADVSSTTTDQFTGSFQNGYEFRGGRAKFDGGIATSTTTVTATTYTALITDSIILVDDDTAGAPVAITLLAAATAGDGFELSVKKLGSTAAVTIDANASETIDGGLTASLTAQYESITIISNGTNWYVI